MTHYSRSNIILPHFEEAALFFEALAGKNASFTFQTCNPAWSGVML